MLEVQFFSIFGYVCISFGTDILQASNPCENCWSYCGRVTCETTHGVHPSWRSRSKLNQIEKVKRTPHTGARESLTKTVPIDGLTGRFNQSKAGRRFTVWSWSRYHWKVIEEELRINRDWLDLARIKASELGTFYCIILDKIIWNDKCKEVTFGLSPEAEVNFDLFYSIIHPDDRNEHGKL